MPVTSILLVEFNDRDAELVAEYLMTFPGEQYLLERVATLADGLRRLSEHSYDIVLMDPALPDVHGLVAVQQVCDAVVSHSALVLVMTEDDSADLFTGALTACAQDVLQKSSIDARGLNRALQAALARRTRQRLRELQSEGREPKERQGEALQVMRRINSRDERKTAPLPRQFEDLMTGQLAAETVLAIMGERIDQLSHAVRSLRRECAKSKVARIRARAWEKDVTAQLRVVNGFIQGSPGEGVPSMDTRIDRLEADDRERKGRAMNRTQTLRELFVQIIAPVVSIVAAALAAWFGLSAGH